MAAGTVCPFFGARRPAKEKEEATIKEGLSTQGETSGVGFAAGNLLPWQRGEIAATATSAPEVPTISNEVSHGPGSPSHGGWMLLFPETQVS